jgi:hypothetical protein
VGTNASIETHIDNRQQESQHGVITQRATVQIFAPHITSIFLYTLIIIFLLEYCGGKVHTGSTRHCIHSWTIVPAPDDCVDGEFCGMNGIGRGNRSTPRKPPRRHFIHHKSHLPDPGANPGRLDGKPATNCFSYGAAFLIIAFVLSSVCPFHIFLKFVLCVADNFNIKFKVNYC